MFATEQEKETAVNSAEAAFREAAAEAEGHAKAATKQTQEWKGTTNWRDMNINKIRMLEAATADAAKDFDVLTNRTSGMVFGPN